MQEIDVNKYVKFKPEDHWLSYQLDRCKVYTDHAAQAPAYCFAERGVFCIFILKKYLIEGGQVLVELLKHELAHGYFGHLRYMKGKAKDRQVLNILFDCSIHVNAADHTVLQTVGDICTYKSCNLPVLPPQVIYDNLKKDKSFNQDMFIENNLSDELWKQKPISDLEHQVIKHSIHQALEDAARDGYGVPMDMGSGIGTDSAEGRDLIMAKDTTPQWIHDIQKYLLDTIPRHKNLSWHREPRNPIGNYILTKGHAPTSSNSKCVFAIDCSYSMEQKYIEQALNAITHATIKEGIEGDAMFFDSNTSERIPIQLTDKILKTAKSRGGGTSLQPVINAVEPNDIVIFYTDGYFNHIDISKMTRPPVFVLTPDHSTYAIPKASPIIPISKHEDDWTEPV